MVALPLPLVLGLNSTRVMVFPFMGNGSSPLLPKNPLLCSTLFSKYRHSETAADSALITFSCAGACSPSVSITALHADAKMIASATNPTLRYCSMTNLLEFTLNGYLPRQPWLKRTPPCDVAACPVNNLV